MLQELPDALNILIVAVVVSQEKCAQHLAAILTTESKINLRSSLIFTLMLSLFLYLPLSVVTKC